MQPQALPRPFSDSPMASYVPGPSNAKDLNTSKFPSPSANICAFMVPERDPAVVTCIKRTRWFSASGRPFGDPLVTYHAPPYSELITTFEPLISELALNAPIQGWFPLSTVPMETSAPSGAASIPMVTQLSNSMLGNVAKKISLTPSAVEPEANASL